MIEAGNKGFANMYSEKQQDLINVGAEVFANLSSERVEAFKQLDMIIAILVPKGALKLGMIPLLIKVRRRLILGLQLLAI